MLLDEQQPLLLRWLWVAAVAATSCCCCCAARSWATGALGVDQGVAEGILQQRTAVLHDPDTVGHAKGSRSSLSKVVLWPMLVLSTCFVPGSAQYCGLCSKCHVVPVAGYFGCGGESCVCVQLLGWPGLDSCQGKQDQGKPKAQCGGVVLEECCWVDSEWRVWSRTPAEGAWVECVTGSRFGQVSA